MASKSTHKRNGSEKLTRVKSSDKVSGDVRVIILRDGTYIVNGTFTGKRYVFEGAGSSQLIDSRDLKYFQNKTSGGDCCGTGLGDQKIFEIET